MRRLAALITVCCFFLWPGASLANALEITLYSVSDQGIGDAIGTIQAEDTAKGLRINPSLQGLQEGGHGFHLHAGSSCDVAPNADGVSVAALAAGGHWDPDNTNTHLGPFADGHRGDLSRLVVDAKGNTSTEVVAPRLKTSDLVGRALIVHAGGDTYSDTPPLGGGGARIACGVAS